MAVDPVKKLHEWLIIPCACYHPPLRLRSKDLWICALLFAAVAGVYSPVRAHEFIHYDDPVYITDNPHIRNGLTLDGLKFAFTSLEFGHWMPLTWTSHMIDCDSFALDAGSHHLVSVFLHGLTTVALFLLLLRLTAAQWPSAFVAFAFGLHPLHVESVAWAAERKDVLSALFSILTLWAYVLYVKQPTRKRYAWVAGFFVCGLLSKSMLVTLPLLMLLLDYWPLRRKLNRQAVPEKLPLFALSIAAAVVTFIAQRRSGAVSALEQIPLGLRIENALVSYAVYIVKFFWPTGLAVFYPHPLAIPAWQWISAAAALAAISAAVYWSKRPYLVTGWLWYLAMLVPVIGIVQVGAQSRADHFTYLPTIGLSIMIAWLAADLAVARYALVGLGAIWVAMTWIDLPAWRNSATLFSRAIEVTDGNWIAYNNLGGALRHRGDLNGAVANFEKAVALRPARADLQDNLGEALSASGRLDDAIAHLKEAIRLQPNWAKAHCDLGAALLQQDRTPEATQEFVQALKIDENYPEAQFRLGGILAAQGKNDEATTLFKAALPYLIEMTRLNPKDPDGHSNLGGVYGLMGMMDDAIKEFQTVLNLRPDDAEAHYHLALAFESKNRMNEAAAEFERAIRLNPGYMMAHFQLAKLLAAMGANVEAEEQFSWVLRLAPNFQPAKDGLAALHR